jgi:hypothetical protein
MPTLVASIIGLLFTMNSLFSSDANMITIVTPVESCVDNNIIPEQNKIKSITDFIPEIDLNLPDF